MSPCGEPDEGHYIPLPRAAPPRPPLPLPCSRSISEPFGKAHAASAVSLRRTGGFAVRTGCPSGRAGSAEGKRRLVESCVRSMGGAARVPTVFPWGQGEGRYSPLPLRPSRSTPYRSGGARPPNPSPLKAGVDVTLQPRTGTAARVMTRGLGRDTRLAPPTRKGCFRDWRDSDHWIHRTALNVRRCGAFVPSPKTQSLRRLLGRRVEGSQGARGEGKGLPLPPPPERVNLRLRGRGLGVSGDASRGEGKVAKHPVAKRRGNSPPPVP
jgi:hypothetical protein